MTTTLVEVRNTYPGSRGAWRSTRYRAAVQALERVELPREVAYRLARPIVALWAQETGDGRGERNYNGGSIHGAGRPDAGEGWHGEVYQGTDAAVVGGTRVPVRFRAYANLDDALADTVQLLSGGGYRAAWGELVRASAYADPGEVAIRRWYDAMTRAGYHPWSQGATDEFVRIWTRLGAV